MDGEERTSDRRAESKEDVFWRAIDPADYDNEYGN